MGVVVQINGTQAKQVAEGYALDVEGRLWTFWHCLGPCYGNVRVLSSSPVQMSTRPHGRGYHRYRLGTHGEAGYLHRLMWKTWKEDPGNNQVRHWDGNKDNNALSNLRLGNQSENEQDKLAHGTRSLGSDSHNAKLTEDSVIQARRLWRDEGWQLKDIKLELSLSVSISSLSEAVTGKTWKHLNFVAPPYQAGNRRTRR